MLTPRSVAPIFSIAMMMLGAGLVSGQAYPTKPVRIFTGSAGGSNDAVARLIASGISGPLGQQVIVENRGSNTISAPIVAQSPPDGYTLLSAGDLIWLGPLLRGNPDAIRDFSPISVMASAPNVLVVHPSLPVKSVKELIALAKASPGELNYASTATGSGNHLSAELFKSLTGVNMVRIPFKGGTPSLIGVVAGEAHLAFLGVFLVSPQVKAGRLRALAVTSAQPSALISGLPTLAAAGVPGFELVGIDAMYAPANTPASIIKRLNQEIVRFLNTTEAKQKYLALGGEVVASSPEEHQAFLNSRTSIIGKLIRDAGIKVD